MKTQADLHGLYVITDSTLIPDDRFEACVEAALRGGARIVQYRDKRADAALREHLARKMVGLCRAYGALSIINDDVGLAARSGADGVHIGKDDIALTHARAALGEAAIIGVSCYNLPELALAAQSGGADYVAFGSFFPSHTKPEAVPASLDMLRRVRAALHVPVCAIGGITAAKGGLLIEAGADMLAVISAVFAAKDIEDSARRFTRLFELKRSKEYVESSKEMGR